MTLDSERSNETEPKARVFISYSRKDMAFTDRLEAALKARGFEPLIDRTEIYAFEDWWKRVEALISRADTVVFVLSPDAVASEVALKEVSQAASLNKRLAPIVCRRVENSVVPEALRRLNFIFFDDQARFEAGADELAEALQIDIGWIRQHTEYGEAEHRWSAAGCPNGLLLHSPILEVAEHWIVSRPRGAPEPTPRIRVFIAESRQGARSAQRRRRFAQGFIYSLLVGIIAGLIGWINQSYILEQWRWFTITRPYLQVQVWPYPLTVKAERALQPMEAFKECARDAPCPEMILIPAGSFIMGSSQTERDNIPEGSFFQGEGPQHSVVIPHPFAVSRFELTFDAWDACATYGDCNQEIRDDGFGRGRQPVINVTWDDAQRYVSWLSKATGKIYRLLTEAEYEYAARAGTTTEYPWGDDIGRGNANCEGCRTDWDGKKPAPVGSFPPNRFGLNDMNGNVMEWVEDCFHDHYRGAPQDASAWIKDADCSFRVIRGGSWMSGPAWSRSAWRGRFQSVARTPRVGFRVARTVSP
jgi:formylglycine-generating enzyme required for sulfatase activity